MSFDLPTLARSSTRRTISRKTEGDTLSDHEAFVATSPRKTSTIRKKTPTSVLAIKTASSPTKPALKITSTSPAPSSSLDTDSSPPPNVPSVSIPSKTRPLPPASSTHRPLRSDHRWSQTSSRSPLAVPPIPPQPFSAGYGPRSPYIWSPSSPPGRHTPPSSLPRPRLGVHDYGPSCSPTATHDISPNCPWIRSPATPSSRLQLEPLNSAHFSGSLTCEQSVQLLIRDMNESFRLFDGPIAEPKRIAHISSPPHPGHTYSHSDPDPTSLPPPPARIHPNSNSHKPPSLLLKNVNGPTVATTTAPTTKKTIPIVTPPTPVAALTQITLHPDRFPLSARRPEFPPIPAKRPDVPRQLVPPIKGTPTQIITPVSATTPQPSTKLASIFTSITSPSFSSAPVSAPVPPLQVQKQPSKVDGVDCTRAKSSSTSPTLNLGSSHILPISPQRTMTLSPIKKKSRTKLRSRRRKNLDLNSGIKSTLNVADIFSAFKRIEADEMLSPYCIRQMNQLRRIREAKETERQDAIENLISMPAAQGNEPAMSTEPSDRTAFPDKSRVLVKPPDRKSAGSTISVPRTEKSDADDDSMSILIYAPASLRRQPDEPLPTVPTIRMESFDGMAKSLRTDLARLLSPRHDSGGSWPMARNTGGLVGLVSTPCSVTMPMFRHGPIRLAKAKHEMSRVTDWTAFQMAVTGAAAGWAAARDDDLEMAADLTEWFDGFGFDGAGKLITERPPREARRREPLPRSPETTPSASPSSSMTPRSADLNPEEPSYDPYASIPIILATDYQTEYWTVEAPSLSDVISATTRFYSPSVSLQSRTGDAGASEWRDSHNNQPRSPMIPLVSPRKGPTSDAVKIVPIGYSLDHNLGP